MCAVAGRGLFRGYDADDLAGIGIGFSLFDMPALAVLAARIVSEEQALRRPVTRRRSLRTPSSVAPVEIAAASDPHIRGPAASRSNPTDLEEERTFDVPIRMVLAPSGA